MMASKLMLDNILLEIYFNFTQLNIVNKSIILSIDDANYLIQYGQYVPEKNAYIMLAGGKGSAKYLFVGVDKAKQYITSFNVEAAKMLEKEAPSLGIQTIKF